MSKVPISIEALLQKQKEEKDAASKPKFLSKEERAKIAIERRKLEIQQEKEKAERTRAHRETLSGMQVDSHESNREIEDFRSNNRARERDSRDHDGRGSRYDDRRRDSRRDGREGDRDHSSRSIPTGPKADRNRGPPHFTSSRAGDMGPPPPPSSAAQSGDSTANGTADDGTGMTSNELSAIRSRYLGVDKKKRPVRKISDRKFVFDWAEQDDTFAMDSPSAVGSQRQGAAVMFGRGHLAGMENNSIPHLPRPGSGAVPDGVALDALGRKKGPVDERHWSEKPLNEMKERDWRIFREDFSISARGGTIPHPLRSWDESDIPAPLLDVIARIGYKEPSPIQRQAIPIGLQNRDLIGIAETGSGKTAAFVIPMLTFIGQLPPLAEENRHLGPYALILAPTRELAQQIESEAKKFAAPLGYKCVSIVGGRAVEEQQFNLREGAEIIIATPGRLKDVIDRHVLVLSQCTYVVMDEADRMVHLGFEVDLTFILDALPSELLKGENSMDVDVVTNNKGRTRVTTLFSATMPPAVDRLARKYLKRAATITIGEAGRAVDTVEQRVEFVAGEEKKKQRLVDLLNNGGFAPPIIVFVNQKKTADMVAKDLQRAHWNASTLHSGKSQEQREAALAQLRNGEADILVATDLAGRGIDVPDVSLVINFQMAGTIEAYVHRIGRTGRAGKTGVAVTFLTNDDDEVMYDLKNEIAKSPISKVPPELARHEAAQQKVTREMKRKRGDDDQVLEAMEILQLLRPPSLLCLGLGSPSDSRASRLQLGLSLEIVEKLFIPLDKVSFCDPVFSEEDMVAFSSLGLRALNGADALLAEHRVSEGTVLIMPHCDIELYQQVLASNWTASGLQKLLVLGNPLDQYTFSTPTKRLEEEFLAVKRLANYSAWMTYNLPEASCDDKAFVALAVQYLSVLGTDRQEVNDSLGLHDD